MPPPVLSIRSLTVTFRGSGPPVPAVRGCDRDVHAGEVLGIVGESGSGKSVTALAAAGLLPPNAAVSGSILLAGREVVGAAPATLRRMRGQDIGLVFPDPAMTLNPLLPVGRQITEGEVAHGRLRPASAWRWRRPSRPPARASSSTVETAPRSSERGQSSRRRAARLRLPAATPRTQQPHRP